MQDPYKQTIMITKHDLHAPCHYSCTRVLNLVLDSTAAVPFTIEYSKPLEK